MTDLVQRLREWAEDAYQHNSHFIPVSEATLREVADEIDLLTAERDAFYMDYRMKCDAETKALTVERDDLRDSLNKLNASFEFANRMLREFVEDHYAIQKQRIVASATVTPSDERDALRKRVKDQRTELRRLNKYLGPYWAGFRRGIDFELSKEIRIRMFKEFGQPAVFIAEQRSAP